MRRLIYISLILLMVGLPSVVSAQLPAPRVLYSVQKFLHPEAGPYIELYFSFDASSFQHQQLENGNYQANVEIGYTIKKYNKIIAFDKYELKGPELTNAEMRQDFADNQTVVLPKGEYLLEITIKDGNRDLKPLTASQLLVINLNQKEAAFSDFLVAKTVQRTDKEGPFIKNGLAFTPWLVSTVPATLGKIYFYTEVYNTDYNLGMSSAYIERHSLKNLDVDSIFPQYGVMKRVNSSKVNVIVKEVDVSQLPQGNYLYTVDIINRENKLVTTNSYAMFVQSDVPELQKEVVVASVANFDQLISSVSSRDTLVDYFRCLRPLADNVQTTYIDNHWKTGENETLKMFIINFWKEREPEDPYGTWLGYRKLVELVDDEYGNAAQRGYDTDRGMIYLRYGAPNQIVTRENEPSSYPYIIWQYYAHPLQANAMYVFYDPTLTFRNYVLLHSNVRGEKKNPRWKLELQRRNTPDGDLDKQEGEQHWGGEVDDYYNNPR